MSKGLIPDEALRNQAADLPWKKSETDKMLDWYFEGTHPKRIAHKLGRNRKAVQRRIEQFVSNERDRAILYEPFRRNSRKHQRITENEQILIRAHFKKGVPLKYTAKVLMRGEAEIDGKSWKKLPALRQKQVLAPEVDLILAVLYARDTYKVELIGEQELAGMIGEEVEYGGAGPVIKGCDPKHVPSYIKSLALYLCEKKELEDK